MQRLLAALLFSSFSLHLEAQAAKAAAFRCAEPHQIPTDLLESRVTIFGEIHGTEQIPEAVSSFVCIKTLDGKRVTLVLEVSADEQNAITRYLGSKGNADDRAALVAGYFWTRPLVNGRSVHDGRASVAMLQLIETVRLHTLAGHRIEVIAAAAYAREQDMDDMLAGAIRRAIANDTEGAVVALMGGNHASAAKGRPWNSTFEGVGYRLRDLKPAIIHATYASGSAWICKQNGCGESTLWEDPTTASRPMGYTPSQRRGFHWTLNLGRVTASSPAVPE